MKKDVKHYDIIIVGGGVVGLTFALAMSELDLSILILDAEPKTVRWSKKNYDLRVMAINTASKNIFSALGVWPAIQAQRISPFQEMQAWAGPGYIHFNSHDIGQPALGYIIENKVIKKALTTRLAAFPHITFLAGVTLVEYLPQDHFTILQTSDQDYYQAPFIVGADGAHSWVRQQAGIELTSWEYGQSAVVAMVETEKKHQQTARQHFLPSGPLAFLPLNYHDDEHFCSIVWSEAPEKAQMLRAMPEEEFKQQLAAAFEYKLGNIISVGQRIVLPLTLRHAKTYVRPGIALMGDAAHTIHPLAGQGVNLGLLDAATLAQVCQDALKKQLVMSQIATLRRYERWRKTENLIMISAMEAFKRLFAAKNPLLRTVRNTGLNITHHASPLKNIIVKRAMGLTGSLPELAKSVQLYP